MTPLPSAGVGVGGYSLQDECLVAPPKVDCVSKATHGAAKSPEMLALGSLWARPSSASRVGCLPHSYLEMAARDIRWHARPFLQEFIGHCPRKPRPLKIQL